MMYAVQLLLQTSRAEPAALLDHVDRVTEELAALDEAHEALLDFAIGVDADRFEVTVELTVQAPSVDDAVACAKSCARSAVHAAGGATPGWDDASTADRVIAYTLEDAQTSLVAAA